jgi:hypothetical protein
MRLVLASLFISLVLVPAASAGGSASFRTPSKNIYCARERLTHTDFLRCDVQKLRHKASRPKGCQFGFGNSFGMKPRGRAHALCVSDSVFDSHAKVLPYGTTRKYGPFSCDSETTGLRCTNRSGHGFSLNRTRFRLF